MGREAPTSCARRPLIARLLAASVFMTVCILTRRLQGVAGMRRCRPATLAAGCFAQFGNLLKRHDPFTICCLGVKTLWRKAVSNSVQDTLSLLQHHVDSLSRASSAAFRRCAFGDATTNREPPQPVGEIFICLVENRIEDRNGHQRRRESDALERNRPPVIIVETHSAHKQPLNPHPSFQPLR